MTQTHAQSGNRRDRYRLPRSTDRKTVAGTDTCADRQGLTQNTQTRTRAQAHVSLRTHTHTCACTRMHVHARAGAQWRRRNRLPTRVDRQYHIQSRETPEEGKADTETRRARWRAKTRSLEKGRGKSLTQERHGRQTNAR
eukprot:3709395-Pleurochrysis_carterae.AAC.3